MPHGIETVLSQGLKAQVRPPAWYPGKNTACAIAGIDAKRTNGVGPGRHNAAGVTHPADVS